MSTVYILQVYNLWNYVQHSKNWSTTVKSRNPKIIVQLSMLTKSFYFGCCKKPKIWKVHNLQPKYIKFFFKNCASFQCKINETFESNGKQLLKCFFLVSWRWVILQHYAEADKVLPFYLPKLGTTLYRIALINLYTNIQIWVSTLLKIFLLILQKLVRDRSQCKIFKY